MPDFEAVGDAVTGGLAGRAVEPGAGESSDGHTHERNCLNCGCELVGDFCHCCGQQAHVHRTIGAWWHDFLHSVLHLDGKFWRTMPMLAWRPGELTRRYAHGERARFISPLALFLFSVFTMFAVFSLVVPSFDLGITRGIEQGLVEERQKLQRFEQRRNAASDEAERTRLDGRIAETREDIERLEKLKAEGVSSADFVDEAEVTGDPLFVAAYNKAKKNPELLLYKLQSNAYKFSWALIPISVPFLWILFLHRRRYRQHFTAYDHLVFVTYSIAFMSLSLIAYVLLNSLGVAGGWVGAIFLLIPPLHMYRQLKGAYGLSRFGALWRTFALTIFAMMALVLFGLLLLTVGAFA